MAIKTKDLKIVPRELPSAFCHKCRQWKVTQERVELFASHDGEPSRPVVWTCPPCRGEAGASPVVAEPETQADIAAVERKGPFRSVVEVIKETGAVTQKVRLECGHETSTFRGAKRARCRKCRKDVS